MRETKGWSPGVDGRDMFAPEGTRELGKASERQNATLGQGRGAGSRSQCALIHLFIHSRSIKGSWTSRVHSCTRQIMGEHLIFAQPVMEDEDAIMP